MGEEQKTLTKGLALAGTYAAAVLLPTGIAVRDFLSYAAYCPSSATAEACDYVLWQGTFAASVATLLGTLPLLLSKPRPKIEGIENKVQ